MPVQRTGPWHKWFAWHPVNTGDWGRTWLRTVNRRRVYLDVPGSPTFWDYAPHRRGTTK